MHYVDVSDYWFCLHIMERELIRLCSSLLLLGNITTDFLHEDLILFQFSIISSKSWLPILKLHTKYQEDDNLECALYK